MDREPALSALQTFARELTSKFRTLGAAQPEDQLKGPVEMLLRAIGGSFGHGVVVNSESRVEDIGRPDLAANVNSLLTGFVELKAPGLTVDHRHFRDHNRQQWNKFKTLPNLIYTNGTDWILYREGSSVQTVRLPGDLTADRGAQLTADDAAALARLMREFFSWSPIVPTTPRRLAELLAPFCHLLRDDVRQALNDPASAMSALAFEWRSYLFPNADDDQFADAYAQTLTYALLLARLSGADLSLPASAESTLRPRHHLLAQVLRILTQPAARQEIALGIDLLERSIAAVDPAALSRGGGDPWLYFYEDFLAAYDPRLRNDRGVYYTPVEVVKAQVNLVADLLRRRLGKPLAYAEEGVVLLDPATGTGTYPLTALQHGLDQVVAAYGPGERGSAASLMARNIHAFELLVGPYAVTHLRISERVLDAGGVLPDDGVHVYLTDTLESPHAVPPNQLPLEARVLVDEHRRAMAVKRETPVLVCIGNPPYDREQREPGDPESQRKGGWVRHGEPGEPEDRALLADFLRPARESGFGVHLKNLYNDYVYFWRWALWKVFESKPGPGIVSFITASSYLRGPGFVGMRELMRRTFDELWIIDLGGDSRGARKTENVFNIQTPVAIAVGVRYGAARPDEPATVWCAKIEGSRAAKLEALAQIEAIGDLRWTRAFDDWQKPFIPVGTGDYFSWPLLTDLFPWQHSGVQVKRSWPIGETQEVLRKRWSELLASDRRATAFRETEARRISQSYEGIVSPFERLPPLASLSQGASGPSPVRYAFRSLDRQWILPDARLIDRPRPPLWAILSSQQLFITSMLSEPLGSGPAAVIANEIPDMHSFCGRGGKDVIPLWRDANAIEPNVTKGLLDLLEASYGMPASAEDLFCYAYGVLGGQAYVERFSDELAIPGPRVPLTKDRELFRRGVALGRKLIALHTYGERFPEALPGGQLPRSSARSIAGIPGTAEGYPGEFHYNAAVEELTAGAGKFGPLAAPVWNYSVSGLQVVKSWLGYRMQDRAGRSSSPLDEIRPERWTLAMTRELLELLGVVEATIALEPELCSHLDEIVTSPVFRAVDLPQPAPEEREPPVILRSSGGVLQTAFLTEA